MGKKILLLISALVAVPPTLIILWSVYELCVGVRLNQVELYLLVRLTPIMFLSSILLLIQAHRSKSPPRSIPEELLPYIRRLHSLAKKVHCEASYGPTRKACGSVILREGFVASIEFNEHESCRCLMADENSIKLAKGIEWNMMAFFSEEWKVVATDTDIIECITADA